jgi:capsid protein
MRAAWLRHRWCGSGLPNIDPKVTVESAKMAAELGFTTLEDGALEYNGSSAKANRAKLRQEFSELPQAPWLQKQEQVTVTEGGAKEREKIETEEEDEAE